MSVNPISEPKENLTIYNYFSNSFNGDYCHYPFYCRFWHDGFVHLKLDLLLMRPVYTRTVFIGHPQTHRLLGFGEIVAMPRNFEILARFVELVCRLPLLLLLHPHPIWTSKHVGRVEINEESAPPVEDGCRKVSRYYGLAWSQFYFHEFVIYIQYHMRYILSGI